MKQLILFSLMPFLTLAQLNKREEHKLNEMRYYDAWEFGEIQHLYYNQKASNAKESKVQSVTYLHGNQRKATKVSFRKWYNQAGKLVRTESKSDTVFYAYQDTLLTTIHRKTKKVDYLTQITYDDQHRMLTKTVKKNNQLQSINTYSYFKGQLRAQMERKTFGRNAHTYLLVNEYEALLHRITKTTFSIDGKIKQTWNYECNEKGKLVDTKLETVNSECRFEQSNSDGSYSIFRRTIVNGKPQLTEILYAADSSQIGFQSYYNDSVVKYSYRKNGNSEMHTNYSKKGKIIGCREIVFDDYGNQIAQNSIDKKGNKKNNSISETNDKHLIVRTTYNNRYVSLFQYTYF